MSILRPFVWCTKWLAERKSGMWWLTGENPLSLRNFFPSFDNSYPLANCTLSHDNHARHLKPVITSFWTATQKLLRPGTDENKKDVTSCLHLIPQRKVSFSLLDSQQVLLDLELTIANVPQAFLQGWKISHFTQDPPKKLSIWTNWT